MSEDLFPYRLKLLRTEKKISLEYLANKVGTTKATLSRYEKGERSPKILIVGRLADFFSVSVAWLAGLSDERETKDDMSVLYNRLVPSRQAKVYNFAENQLKEQEINNSKIIPIVGKTAANPSVLEYGDVDIEQQSFSHVPEGADCALNVQGDSMEPLIKDGSIVFYKKQQDVENGEIAIIEVDGDGVTCKKVIKDYDNRQVILKSINENYEDRILRNEKIRIIGKVIL